MSQDFEKITAEDLRGMAVPVIPMRTQVFFPNVASTFDVGRAQSISALDHAKKNSSLIFLVKQRDASVDDVSPRDLYEVGTVAKITQLSRLPGNRVRVYVRTLFRARLDKISSYEGNYYAYAAEITPIHADEFLEEAHFRAVKDVVKDIFASEGKFSKEVEEKLSLHTEINDYIDVCAQYMRIKETYKQELLQTADTLTRIQLLERCLNDELEISKIESSIAKEVRKNIEQSQKEYYLREQIKAIHTELGDGVEENEQLKEKLLAKKLPKAVEEKALIELARMDKMPPSSPEYTVLRNYADWLIDLPWHEQTEDTKSLKEVEKILDADHYGLEKIKERVVEYLAVLKLTGTLKAPILCLVGPPGVGKTSIAKSVARALKRKFVRMSLGGLKDEAEIRGHRRTYIGAMPGRIVYEMKNAGAINPVFLLDEVDKISSDMRGDPSSALLEVLDPEQNSTFRDRYLEVEYDLSKVMFIATANTLDTIPAPLRDRMEIIELSGYTPQEKEQIAKHYLIPKKRKENGLTDKQIKIADGALKQIIDGYTMESGVRNLERVIGSVCRKAAVKIAKDEGEKITVNQKNLEEFLGGKRYLREENMREKDEVGAATGLAWTSVGGTTLTIEVSTMPGKGEIVLTGKLGDVMKESARAAISYIRANAQKYGVKEEDFEKKDLHIHVPEGATPKDGPSAGITMATAILSAFTQKPVRRDIAMTGEITLRGKVLPIGGLKEKALAAHRIGISDIIIPQENKKDLEEIPSTVKEKLNFICVSHVDEVFSAASIGGGNGN